MIPPASSGSDSSGTARPTAPVLHRRACPSIGLSIAWPLAELIEKFLAFDFKREQRRPWPWHPGD